MTAPAPTAQGTKTLRSPAYLEGTDIDLFAPVYAACASRGISALDVDEMEVWQVATILEVDMGTADGAGDLEDLASRRAAALRARGKTPAQAG